MVSDVTGSLAFSLWPPMVLMFVLDGNAAEVLCILSCTDCQVLSGQSSVHWLLVGGAAADRTFGQGPFGNLSSVIESFLTLTGIE